MSYLETYFFSTEDPPPPTASACDTVPTGMHYNGCVVLSNILCHMLSLVIFIIIFMYFSASFTEMCTDCVCGVDTGNVVEPPRRCRKSFPEMTREEARCTCKNLCSRAKTWRGEKWCGAYTFGQGWRNSCTLYINNKDTFSNYFSGGEFKRPDCKIDEEPWGSKHEPYGSLEGFFTKDKFKKIEAPGGYENGGYEGCYAKNCKNILCLNTMPVIFKHNI